MISNKIILICKLLDKNNVNLIIKSNIILALGISLKQNYFHFKNITYTCKEGLIMGKPIAPLHTEISKLFINNFLFTLMKPYYVIGIPTDKWLMFLLHKHSPSKYQLYYWITTGKWKKKFYFFFWFPTWVEKQLVTVSVNYKHAQKILNAGKVKIGGLNCRIRQKCFGYMSFVYVARNCQGPQRANAC